MQRLHLEILCRLRTVTLLWGDRMDKDALPELPCLVKRAANGDEEAFAAVMRRMTPMIKAQIHRFQHIGADEDDLAQECLVGLLTAVRHYRDDVGAAFTTFACTCIHNRLVSMARRYGAKLQRERPLESDSQVPDTNSSNPENRLLEQEGFSQLQAQLQQRLTPLEHAVLLARLSDQTYEQIATRLGVSKKTVDNAVQRLRRKFSAET